MTPGLLLRGGLVYRDGGFSAADVHIEDGLIVAVAPDLPVPVAASVIPVDGDLVIPGLVNAHYHSPDNLNTGRFAHAPLELWSLASVPSRSADPDALRTSALFGAAQMLLGGVTGAVDMVRVPGALDGEAYDAIAGAYLESGMRAAIAPVLADLPPDRTIPLGPWQPAAPDPAGIDAAIGGIERLAGRWHGRDGRVTVQVAPSGPQRCTDELFSAAIALARRLGTPLHTHALETRAQARQARLRWGEPLISHLEHVGALSPATVLAHLVWPEPAEIDLLERTAAVVVHNPASNLSLGSGLAPLPEMLARGIPIALGTDAATCNDGLSLFETMKLATIVHRAAEPDPRRWPTPGTAFAAATEGGAAALGLAGRAGRIATGQIADLVVLDGRGTAFVPPNDLSHQLVFRSGPHDVRHVFVAGRQVVRDRGLLTLDLEQLSVSMRHHARTSAPLSPTDPAVESAIRAMLDASRRTA